MAACGRGAARRGGWRLNSQLTRTLNFTDAAGRRSIAVRYTGSGALFNVDAGAEWRQLFWIAGRDYSAKLDGQPLRGAVVPDGEQLDVYAYDDHTILEYADPLAHADDIEAEPGAITAPMRGRIVVVLVVARGRRTVAK